MEKNRYGNDVTLMLRTQSSLDLGVVRLWNRWLDRRWSAFSGASTELKLHPSGKDVFTRKSPEYHLDIDGEPTAVWDLGNVSWSETCDDCGAAVVLEQSRTGLYLTVETFMPHHVPGIVRQLSVSNTGTRSIRVTRVAADILPLAPDQFQKGRQDAFRSRLQDQDIYYQTLLGRPLSLCLGSTQADGFALFSPNPDFCATVWTGNETIAPGKTWKTQPVGLVQCPLDAPEAVRERLNALHAAWEGHVFVGR